MPSQRLFTQEAAGYLIPLLDKERDAAEIADLRAKQSRLDALPRAITPVAIPLTDDATGARHRRSAGAGAVSTQTARAARRGRGSRRMPAGWSTTPRTAARSPRRCSGSATSRFWLFWSNGYEPMRALDDNGDGELRGGGTASTSRSGTTATAMASRTREKCGRSPRTASWRCRATTSRRRRARFAALSPRGARLRTAARARPTTSSSITPRRR